MKCVSCENGEVKFRLAYYKAHLKYGKYDSQDDDLSK